jgi:hypothetical protein
MPKAPQSEKTILVLELFLKSEPEENYCLYVMSLDFSNGRFLFCENHTPECH